MAKNKEIVLFLGAGASRAFNYPIVSEILPGIIDALKARKIFTGNNNDTYHFLLEELLIALSPGLEGHIKKNTPAKNLPLVTDLLSMLDHFIVNGQELKDWNFELSKKHQPESVHARWSLRDLKMLFEYAIAKIITHDKGNDNPKMKHFFDWITKTNKSGKCFINIVTTNYDFSVEDNLLKVEEAYDADTLIDYGFAWRDPNKDVIYPRPESPRFRVLKLHGSVDWLKCERCSHVYINTTLGIFDLPFDNHKIPANSCDCGYWPLSPMLVTPSFVRGAYETNLQEVWKISLETMRKADEWIFAGYSMPSEDFGIKSLLLRSMHGRKTMPKITVLQQSHRSKPAYDNFFGDGNYNFICGGIEAYDFEKEVGPACTHAEK